MDKSKFINWKYYKPKILSIKDSIIFNLSQKKFWLVLIDKLQLIDFPFY